MVLAATIGGLATAARAATISTLPASTGRSSVSYFGDSNTSVYAATVGQTISVSTPQYLNDFTFYLKRGGMSSAFTAHPYVYAWNGTEATGSALFTGPTETISDASAFDPFTVNTGNTYLAAGTYVLFFTVSDPADYQTTTSAYSQVEATDGYANVYSGGTFVYDNNGSDFAALTSTAWDGNTAYDLAFTADISAVPEPTMASMATASTAALLGLRRRRRQRVGRGEQ